VQKFLVYLFYKVGTNWRILLFGVVLFLLVALLFGSTTLPDLAYFKVVDSDKDRGATVLPTDPFDRPLTKIVYLDQNWVESDSLWFYNITQGSNLLPYDFFLKLEQEHSQELFRSPENMNRLRYLPQKKTGSNPDALPVGMVADEYRGKKYMGFTCAACHSGQVNHNGTGIRIDGGPGGADMDTFMWDLEGSVYQTLFDEAKFKRFSAEIIKLGNYKNDKEVIDELNKFLVRLQAYNFFNTSKVKGVVDANGNEIYVPYGYGRLDAFGRIYNRVLEHILNREPLEVAIRSVMPAAQVEPLLAKMKPVLSGDDRDHLVERLVLALKDSGFGKLQELRDKLFNSPNAPVSYPFIWDIPQHDYVQWNGIAENASVGPLGRNTGEVIGVFGTLDWAEKKGWSLYAALGGQGLFHKRHISFESSINAQNLRRIEERLRDLQSPLWSDAVTKAGLPAIVEEPRERGKKLFEAQCARCHAEIFRSDENRRIVAQMSKIDPNGGVGTDATMAVNSVSYNGFSGILRNWYAKTPVGDILLNTRAPVAAELTRATQNVVATPDPDKWWWRRGADWAVNTIHSFINVIRPSVKSGNYTPDTTQAPFSSLLSYKARSLNGIWATAPYLHNGSVPTLYDLLLPAKAESGDPAGMKYRPTKFLVGSRELDTVHVGFRHELGSYDGFEFDTSKPANSNAGHEYGSRQLSEQDRMDLVEFLKSL
jgi:mono/diheme cytochrome c family protein